MEWKFEMVALFKAGKIAEARKLLCGKIRADEIEEVYSVDLVGDPATNKGLFESKTMRKTIKQIIESNTSHPFTKTLREMMDEEVLTEMDMGDEYEPESLEVEVE
jgi:hypothetical protein